MDLESLKYPIGRFSEPKRISEEMLAQAIQDIKQFPSILRLELEGLTPDRLELPYRTGGWNTRQVVHHLADSHINALVRLKLALTEENPTINPYREELWAQLADYSVPILVSLNLLESVHERWHLLLESLTPSDWNRTFYHPESQKNYDLRTHTLLYQWHGNHHLSHIRLVTAHRRH